MLYFTAPYGDRREISDLGGEWDFTKWKWLVKERKDYKKFSKWLDGGLITDEIYVLGAKAVCPHCGKQAKVAAVAIGGYSEEYGEDVYGADSINILNGFEYISGGLAEYVKKNFPVKKRFFAPYGYKYLVNGCPHCDGIIPDDSLFGEENSPFFINSEQKVNNLDVRKADYPFDVALKAKVALSFEKKLFRGVGIEKIKIEF